MADQTQRLELATVRAEIGGNILFRFSNDPANGSPISTVSGDIKNLKQVVLEIQDDAAEKISIATTIYPTVAAGLAATANQSIFLVQSSNADEIYNVWMNNGGTAVNTGKTAISSQAVLAAVDAAQEAAQVAENLTAGIIPPTTTAPVTRVNGDPLQVGDSYFNAANQMEYIYKVGGWVERGSEESEGYTNEQVGGLRKEVSIQRCPRGQSNKDSPLIFSVAGAQALVGFQQKLPRGPENRRGSNMMLGDTPILPMIPLFRPRSRSFNSAVVLVSGDSVMMESGGSATPVAPVVTYDAKQIQEQNQATAPTRFVTISGGQVIAYDAIGPTQLTQAGTWLAAQALAFDIVRALKANPLDASKPQPHSITKDGRIFRDGQVLLHKLSVGQSLALGSRGIVPNPAGDYTIGGVRGNLFSPSTPPGYADKLWTLAGGPRPANWEGTTAFEPVREYVAGVLGETPATSYMLAMRTWHERTTSIAPQLLFSISAVGGTPYSGLKKGTAPYANAISQVTTAKSIANGMSLDYVVPSISITHGESQSNTTRAQYVTYQIEWGTDYRIDVPAITGQAIPPTIFITQMLTGDPGVAMAGIPLAQTDVCETVDWFIMVGPKYNEPYFDTYHMLAPGYINMGGREARAERLTMVSGKWQPLKVLSAAVSGSTITLRLNNLPSGNAGTPGPIGKLVADTVTVSDPGNLGFQLSAGTINTVAIGADGVSIVITAAAAIAAGTTLTYALQPDLNSPQNGNGRRGCIRDTDLRDLSRFDGKPIHNWLCAFSKTLEL